MLRPDRQWLLVVQPYSPTGMKTGHENGYWLLVIGCLCRGVAFAPKYSGITDNITMQMLRPDRQ